MLSLSVGRNTLSLALLLKEKGLGDEVMKERSKGVRCLSKLLSWLRQRYLPDSISLDKRHGS